MKKIESLNYSSEPNKYSINSIKSVWNRPLEHSYSPNLKEKLNFQKIFNNRMIGDYRIRTSFTTQDNPENPFIGKWNLQFENNTDSVMSFANSHRVIGIDPHFSLLTKLINSVKEFKKDNNDGNSLTYVHKSLEIEKINNVLFDRLQPQLRRHNKYDLNESNQENAIKIKRIIDDKEVIVTRINQKAYSMNKYSDNNNFRSIVLSGYFIGHNNEMNVQLIDPKLGIMWTSLEHFTFSNVPEETYVLKLRNI